MGINTLVSSLVDYHPYGAFTVRCAWYSILHIMVQVRGQAELLVLNCWP